jgi:hypothetical protein
MKNANKLTPLVCAAVLMPIGSAHATFALIENFEGMTTGALGSQNGWTSDADYTVVADPDGGGNQVLQFSGSAQAGAYLAMGASSVSGTGTLFTRFRFDADGNANFGMTDVDDPGAYNDFRVQVNRQSSTPIKGRDGGGFQDLNSIAGGGGLLADNANTWYNMWVVADNTATSSRVFIQSNDDPDFLSQTEVFPPDGTLNFRSATAGDLDRLMLRSQAGTAFFDDFHVSAGTDLSNPTIPEPTAPALALLGLTVFLRRKRS